MGTERTTRGHGLVQTCRGLGEKVHKSTKPLAIEKLKPESDISPKIVGRSKT